MYRASLVWFASALVLLAVAGHLVWVVALAALCVLNQVLAAVWEQ